MLRVLIYTILFIGIFFGYLKYIESRSVFFPTKYLEATPEIIHLTFQDVYLKTKDKVNIHGWFIPYDGTTHTILFLHGNAGNISHRLEKIILLRRAKVNIFIVDYRGYGESEGKPTEKGVYLDTQAAYNYLTVDRKINPKDIILYGESLGATAAIDLASNFKVGALILEGAFSSGRDMAKIMYPFLPSFLFSSKYNSLAKIKEIKEPKLFIHSKSDEIIPFELAKKLFDAAVLPKQFLEIRGSHNDGFIDSEEEYSGGIIEFIKNLKQ